MAIYSRIPVPPPPPPPHSLLSPFRREATHIPDASESGAVTICLYSKALSRADTLMLIGKLADERRRDAKQPGICLQREGGGGFPSDELDKL